MNYKGGRWKAKREAILRRDKYTCQESKRYGKRITANTVHHIYPVELYPALAFLSWNLVSLSAEKHNAMHDRETHELTALGLEWQRRRAPQFKAWLEDRS